MSGGFSSEQFGEDTGKGFTMNPNRRIPTWKAIEILEDCRELGVKAIQFTGGGEPTVHPEHLAIFDTALDMGFECGLVTNGYLLRKGWEEILPRFAWIRVSVDADNAESYSQIRGAPAYAYDRVMSNIAEIRSRIDDSTLLGCGYVVTPDNWRGLVKGVERIRDAGAAYVRLSAMFSTDFLAPYDKIYDAVKQRVKAAGQKSTPAFEVVDLFGDRITDLATEAPNYDFCGYQQFNMYIGGNLKVYRCCTTAYTKHGEVGDLNNQRMIDWFRSDQKWQAYANFKARSCNVCQFNNKNRVINTLTQEPPLHANFV